MKYEVQFLKIIDSVLPKLESVFCINWEVNTLRVLLKIWWEYDRFHETIVL